MGVPLPKLRFAGAVTFGAGLVAAAAVLTGCASATPAGGAGTPASASTSAPASSSGPATSAPASSSAPATSAPASPSAKPTPSVVSPSGTASGGEAACATRALRAKAGASQGAAGSVYLNIDLTNISNAACTMYGYPGVSLAAGTPVKQLGAAATRSNAAAPAVVTLQPGQTASALLRITQAVNYPAAQCSPQTTTYLQIYPPNQTAPIYLPYPSTGCALTSVNLLTIGVVQPGAGS
jgi:hypothetical protein